ncbi:MAG: Na+/H+ antiporter NhaA [Gemmatimonadota bacterium]|nr:Na+/H+ antiporter NhaA [Gemmatimonadota bacterium]
MTGSSGDEPVPARARGILRERGSRSPLARELLLPAQSFIHASGSGGFLLLAATAVALVWANSPWAASYEALWTAELRIDLGPFSLHQAVRETVNSALMTIFFFLVGLEIKRELLEGDLARPRDALLPAIAAVGGMVVPVLFFLAVATAPEARGAWGLPMATDIAFALAVLALLGSRVPDELRAVLLTIAVIDDIGSVLVIAIFYTSEISLVALAVAGGILLVILAVRASGVLSGVVYGLLGASLWLAVHQSGVHATIAGVALGLLTPIRAPFPLSSLRERLDPLLERFDRAREVGRPEIAELQLGRMTELVRETEAPLDRMQRLVLPWSSYVVLPLFALANAGIRIDPSSVAAALGSPVAQGAALGLVAGKVVGISGFSWLAVRTGIANLPSPLTNRHMVGLGLIGGIGFTVSIFVAGLAVEGASLQAAKLGILAASGFSGIAGYLLLRFGASSGDGSETTDADRHESDRRNRDG